ncbi:MAG: InlB B-repeat-containing protein, partial [Synergistaceae bacterium]|nr:InlB B-repeat-containing protein [Synergistaceae bacterium]
MWDTASQLPILYWQKLPVVNAATLPGGTVGVAYSSSVTATNNPTGFSLSNGPPGLSINNSGAISGTPTTAGTFTFVVSASNSVGPSLGGQAFSIAIASAPTYTVTFDSQGGNAVAQINPPQNTTITEPAVPTRSGYSFIGWYREAACINAWNFSSDTVTANITLYAKWTPTPTYTVTFDSQGGSAVAQMNPPQNTTITEPAAPTRSGYSFIGWYKEAACIDAWDFSSDTVTANITLYAKWTAGPVHTVTFDSQGGGMVAPASAIPGTTITAPAIPTRAGYSFGGWYKEPACVNAWDFSADAVTADITLYAKWTAAGNAPPGAVDSIEISRFPLTLAPGDRFTATVAYTASGGEPDPEPVLSVSVEGGGAPLVSIDILPPDEVVVRALPQDSSIARGASDNSAVYGEAVINFTATQTAGGTVYQKTAAVPLVIADKLATSVVASERAEDEFKEANAGLAPSDEFILPGNAQQP